MNTTTQTYYVVMALRRWDNLSIGYGPAVLGDGTSPDGSAFYLSVYETREQAETAHPGRDIVAVRPTQQEED
jgi:hypothetical protein